ncbi:MAG: [FeFe] hydrogenase H-cluster maturation GTPase HydF [Rikenellaceae bacterium]|jgi:[FeFe] hydrogenase H-cluster maturation GTPase HydF|nr:[FeFe] hydrogenase H-cluster maturation GTPase HydF [Rikenellaceae bacterium]
MLKGKENTPHIGIFGRVNAGKSTLLNFLTGAATAITSSVAGTTTDPVRKSYEIAGFSPVVLIDTAGVDDPSALGSERMRRTVEAARQVDLALVVYREWLPKEERLYRWLLNEDTPVILVRNVWDGGPARPRLAESSQKPVPEIAINLAAPAPGDHTALLDRIKARLPERSREAVKMFGDLLAAGDHVVLVCPIDAGAPAGRMILPQVQALREVLDARATAHVVQPAELAALLGSLAAGGVRPRMVVTDSQAYGPVRAATPGGMEVTTFSILLAAVKGDYELYTRGLETVRALRDGDRVLVCEFCSHQVSCDDIARVKIPALMQKFTGRELAFTYVAPSEPLPADAASHALMLVCGGCMATRTQVRHRIARARDMGLPATNFGMLLRLVAGGKQ